METEARKAALMKTLREDFGITTPMELVQAIRNMKKLDITQFVYDPRKGGPQNVPGK